MDKKERQVLKTSDTQKKLVKSTASKPSPKPVRVNTADTVECMKIDDFVDELESKLECLFDDNVDKVETGRNEQKITTAISDLEETKGQKQEKDKTKKIDKEIKPDKQNIPSGLKKKSDIDNKPKEIKPTASKIEVIKEQKQEVSKIKKIERAIKSATKDGRSELKKKVSIAEREKDQQKDTEDKKASKGIIDKDINYTETEKFSNNKPDIKIEPEKLDSKEGEKKSSRVVFVFSGILIITGIVISLIIFKSVDWFDRNKHVKISVSHKIEKPPIKIQTPKIIHPSTKIISQQSEPTKVSKAVTSQNIFQEKKVALSVENKTDVSNEINEFLIKWKTAWENTAGQNGDIKTYMSFFSEDFFSSGLDKNGWENDKAEKNRRKARIRVELKKINIVRPLENNRIEVSFLQDYKSSNFSDTSDKAIVLKKEKSDWKIIGIKTVSDSNR